MKVDTRSQNHPPGDEEKIMTRKQKADKQEHEQSPNKKPKSEDNNNNNNNGNKSNNKSLADIVAEFDNFCKTTSQHLSIEQMREILEANNADSSGSDDAVVPRCQDMMFYGVLKECPICGGTLHHDGHNYICEGSYSEWSTCTYSTNDPPRIEEPIKYPDFVQDSPISDLLMEHRDRKGKLKRDIKSKDKPFAGMIISLSGRLSRTHQYWKTKIEKHGGKVANHVMGVTCLVVSSSERDRGGSSKVAEALERSIAVVREAWLNDSIEKDEPQPLDAYDVVSDLAVDGKEIQWDMQDPSQEALESLNAEIKMYGKRGVHKDSRLDKGGVIFEKDGIIYNCALSVSDRGRKVNEICVMQLIMVPENHLHLYYKRGKVGADPRAEERVEEKKNVDEAIKEFAELFEELTGNEFEPWEREKKIQKKPRKFYPIDVDDGYDVRFGGLGLRQLGAAAAHCKLDPFVANFMKLLCGQEIYRYALMEMELDAPDLPVAMLTDFHIKTCEETLLEFVEKLFKTIEGEEDKPNAVWSDFSQRWFTLLHSTRPFIFRDHQDLADHGASVLETVRDINVASRIIEDMSGSTIDDQLFDRYKKLGCSISPLEKESDDYKMILKYVEKTYEPVKVGEISYGISVENVFQVEVGAGPSYDEIKKLPNKVLLWCGTRSSNLLRHLHKGFLPAVCTLPVSGYMFGRAIVCSDAAAEAARYGYTAVDRPEGFLVLAVASLGKEITEITSVPDDTESLEEKKAGVKGLGRKKTNEKEHFVWKDDIMVPCGSLVESEHKESPLEYNEYAVYDPNQVIIRFLVGVKFEEQDVVYEEVDPAGADAPVE